MSKELRALSDEELEYVTGGVGVTNENLNPFNITFDNSTKALEPEIITD